MGEQNAGQKAAVDEFVIQCSADDISQQEPDLQKAAALFAEFCRTVAMLRDKDKGCPWDMTQTHSSLRKYMLEEAYEAFSVMSDDRAGRNLCEELGDVLLQVVLNAQVAHDDRRFDVTDVVKGINAKMKRRHPHVFGTSVERQQRSPADIKKKWQEIKAQEKQLEQQISQQKTEAGFFDGVRHVHPASHQAVAIGKLAKTIQFDWGDASEVWKQVVSEVDEVAQELSNQPKSQDAITTELGDLYFSLAQLCRHLNLDPELVAAQGNEKFLKRFQILEEIARAKSISIQNATQEQLEKLWQQAKSRPCRS